MDLAHLDAHVNGLERVRETRAATGRPSAWPRPAAFAAEDIRRIAREFCAAPSAAWYGRIGTCNQEFGTLASWLVDVLNIVTGNLDRRGGMMFSKPIAWSMVRCPTRSGPTASRSVAGSSRVRGAPEVLGQYPAACLAEEIATPGDGASPGA